MKNGGGEIKVNNFLIIKDFINIESDSYIVENNRINVDINNGN